MKWLGVFVVLCLVTACSYSYRVQSINDNELCDRLGQYVLYGHSAGTTITRAEIERRNLDKGACAERAGAVIDRLSPQHKLKLCQDLAAYQYKGAYEHFKSTLDQIVARGYADDECITMAEFYYVKLARKQEKAVAIAAALNGVAQGMRESNQLLWERLYGPGTALNPVHTKVE
jgi:hypothetical protein